jgi:hypothetical protein
MTEPMLIGGTDVDDEVMALVRLSELARTDERAQGELRGISEIIDLALHAALERAEEPDEE